MNKEKNMLGLSKRRHFTSPKLTQDATGVTEWKHLKKRVLVTMPWEARRLQIHEVFEMASPSQRNLKI